MCRLWCSGAHTPVHRRLLLLLLGLLNSHCLLRGVDGLLLLLLVLLCG
jgi:hypothetical protein